MTKKQVKKEIIEVQPEAPKEEVKNEDILTAGAARQRKQEDAGAASAAFEIEEVEEEKPKKKREVTEAMKEHLATIRIKALKVKAEKKELREKAKQLENAELQLKADKYDKAVDETKRLKTPPKQEIKEEVACPKGRASVPFEEVVEEVKPKKVKKVIKKVVEESESEEEVEEVIIKKSSKNNKPLTNDEKIQLVNQTAEERLKKSLKEDRLNYLLCQIGAKL